MAMVASLALGLFFLFMAHSTLLHFYAEDHRDQSVPLLAALLPWPNRGRVVAVMCLLPAALFLYAAVLTSDTFHFTAMSSAAWMVFSIFVVFPYVFYGCFLARRIRKDKGTYRFRLMPSSGREMRAPLVLAAVISSVGYLVR